MEKFKVGRRYSFVARLGSGGEAPFSGLVIDLKPDHVIVNVDTSKANMSTIPRAAILYAKVERPSPNNLVGVTRVQTNVENQTEQPKASDANPDFEYLAGNSRLTTGTLDQLTKDIGASSQFSSDEEEQLLRAIGAVGRFHGTAAFRHKRAALEAALRGLEEVHFQERPDRANPVQIVTWLRSAAQLAWSEYSTNRTSQVEIASPGATQTYALRGNIFNLQLSLKVPLGAPDAESVFVHIAPAPNFKPTSPRMTPRITDELPVDIPIEIRVSDLGVQLGEIEIRLHASYTGSDGNKYESEQFTHVARLTDSSHHPAVRNPFSIYSGGTPIEDSEMFFGREELLTEFSTLLKTGPLGQCFVLYGQKRSGKSSVLKQLRLRLPEPVICIEVSLGAIDTGSADRSFIHLCIDEFQVFLLNHWDDTQGRAQSVLDSWPSDDRIAAEPLQSFRRALRTVREVYVRSGRGAAKVKPVILIDEFTYVHEYIRTGVMSDSFMRQWKALLQTGQFSAVVAGQDTMQEFIDAYPNEFAVTNSRRLNYLTSREASALAELPILMPDGESRYKGTALERLVEATGGSPFYTQILCDRIVQNLNRQHLQFVTPSIVDETIKSLVSGRDKLPLDRFDPLLTAASASVASFQRDVYVEYLHHAAVMSSLGPATRSALVRNSQDEELFDELTHREVLVECDAQSYKLGVNLFAEWLRSNG